MRRTFLSFVVVALLAASLVESSAVAAQPAPHLSPTSSPTATPSPSPQPTREELCIAAGLLPDCQPETTSDSVVILATVGSLTNNYIWTFNDTLRYYIVDSSGNSLQIGTVRVTANINLNGRQSRWTQTTQVLSGPAIKATHRWNCVDDNGNLPNTECNGDGGWWVSNSDATYRSSTFTTNRTNYHAQTETYWYDFEYRWLAQGWPGFSWYSGSGSSYSFSCRNVQTNPCRFRW